MKNIPRFGGEANNESHSIQLVGHDGRTQMNFNSSLFGLLFVAGAIPTGGAFAQSECASLSFSRYGSGSNAGAYYRVINRCGYNVFFRYVAGVDGTGQRSRDYNVFIGNGSNKEMFIYGPLPKSYSVVRQ